MASISSGGSHLLASAARGLFEAVPRRGAYFEQTLRNTLPGSVGKTAATVFSKFTDWEFHKFFNLAGPITAPEFPMSVMIGFFYPFCIGGRLHSGYERAPLVPLSPKEQQKRINKAAQTGEVPNLEPHKDLRELRDVTIRDVLAISIFLFALGPIQAQLQKITENHGSLIPFLKRASLRLHNPLGVAFDYNQPTHPYRLANEGSLLQILKDPFNQNRMPDVLKQELEALEAYEKLPGFKKHAQLLIQAINASGKHLHDEVHLPVTDFIKNKTPQAVLNHLYGGQPNEALAKLSQHMVSLFTDVAGADRHESLSKLTLPQYQQLFNAQHQGINQRFEAALTTLEEAHPSDKPSALKALLDKLKGQDLPDLKDLQAFEDFSFNKHGAINKYLKEVLGLEGEGFGKAFQIHWDALTELRNLLPQRHALHQAQALLENPEVAPGIFKGLKSAMAKAYEAVGNNAQSHISQLEGFIKGHNGFIGKKLFGCIPMERLKPRQMLIKFANGLRTPADWVGLMIIVALLGYFPVWFNDKLTRYLFERKHGQAPPSPVLQPFVQPGPVFNKPSATLPTVNALTAAYVLKQQTLPPQLNQAAANPFTPAY